MIDEQKLRELAEALTGFGLTSARSVDGDDSGQAELGQELDGEFYSVGIFDTFQYDEPDVSLKLARFYASANPSAIIALLDELQSLRSERTALLVNEQNLLEELAALRASLVEPVAWAVYWGEGYKRKHSVYFDFETAKQVDSEISSFLTEVRPLYALSNKETP